MSANSSGGGLSARERLDELAVQLASTMAASLDAVETMVGQHTDKMLASMERVSDRFEKQTDAATAIVARLQDSMLLLGGEFKKLADRLAIAEARIEMLEGRFETRQ